MVGSVSAASGALLLLLAATPRLAAQVAVAGTVREDGTGQPLQGVEVLIEGSKRTATTDADGKFLLDAPTGTKVALFRAIGFRPYRLRLMLSKGDSVTANAELVREGAQQLDSIVVTGHASRPRGVGVEAFEERRRMGFGKFIDSTALRRFEHRKVVDVLRDTPGLNFVAYVEFAGRPYDFEWRLASSRSQEMFGAPCWMSVYFDGSPIYRSGGRSPPPDFRRELSDVSNLQAIEVYRSASEVPLEYGGAAHECGLLLLWSRR